MQVQCSISSNACQHFLKDEKKYVRGLSSSCGRTTSLTLFSLTPKRPKSVCKCTSPKGIRILFLGIHSFINSETAEIGRNLSTNPLGFQNRAEFSSSNPADNHMLIKFVLDLFYFLKPLELVSEANLSFTSYIILGFLFFKLENSCILSQFSRS